MTPSRFFSLPVRYKPWRPYHLRLVAADIKGAARQAGRDHRVHLSAAIDWLCRAQDIRDAQPDSGGVSAGWNFEDGWLPGYPETSGYIVETFLAAAAILSRPELVDRTQRILDWELSLQLADGAFPGHFGEPGSRPVIFNTGQIMHGLVAGWFELQREECLKAAIRAGRWLVAQQDEDGCWRRSVHNGVPHTYNTRAAWALLRTGLAADEADLREAAARNLRWALAQQAPSGWLRANAFTAGAAPFTHTIAYALRGLLESAVLLGDEPMFAAAEKAARALASRQRADGWLAGTYSDEWRPASRYCCLTGLAQMCLVWQRLGQILGSDEFAGSVRVGLGYLKRCQRITGRGTPDDGGIAGSAPIWGRYSMFEFPNWAAKFFADALMMDMEEIIVPTVHQERLREPAGVREGG